MQDQVPFACKIRFQSIVDGVWPDYELDIIFEQGDEEISALVPAWAVDKENLTVESWIVRLEDDVVVAKLPPTQVGSRTVKVMAESILR